jgi:hypothetical protein
VRIDPNDPHMTLRWYAVPGETGKGGKDLSGKPSWPDGETGPGTTEKDTYPWRNALATITPGRSLPGVRDLDSFLNISLDGDDDAAGGSGSRRYVMGSPFTNQEPYTFYL